MIAVMRRELIMHGFYANCAAICLRPILCGVEDSRNLDVILFDLIDSNVWQRWKNQFAPPC
jgi:hypothetical protein